MLRSFSKAKADGGGDCRRVTDISPRVRALIDESKKRDAEDRKNHRLRRAMMVPVLMTQVAPLATNVTQALQPIARQAAHAVDDIYEGIGRSR
jgi:dihydroxyacetone kinase